jgi:rhodanese-related sulfurtransferase
MKSQRPSFRKARWFLVSFWLIATALAVGGCSARCKDDDSTACIDSLYEEFRKEFADTPDLDVETLLRRSGDPGVIVVDVREPEEREVSMIPDSITREQFDADPDLYKQRLIVTVCTIGHRSGHYAQDLRKRGFQATNLRGGILSWTHAHQPLAGPDGPTRRVHVYGPDWNFAAEGYEAVW